jgi:hypothetical protein
MWWMIWDGLKLSIYVAMSVILIDFAYKCYIAEKIMYMSYKDLMVGSLFLAVCFLTLAIKKLIE